MKSVTLIEFDFRMMSEAVIHLTLDMHNSSHHTKLHSITAKYFNFFYCFAIRDLMIGVK